MRSTNLSLPAVTAPLALLVANVLPSQAWITAHGSGSSEYHFADVDGDGLQDAVTLDGSFIYVAKSNGWFFDPRQNAGLASAPGETHFADINGDGREDLVRFQSTNGEWRVELASSTGSFFGGPRQWIQGHGIGSNRRFLEDVDGDGLADAVIFFGASGDWWVAKSLGSSFGTPSLWISNHGIGSQNQFLGDCDGDSRADSVVFFEPTGDWWVGLSNGSQFLPYTQWDTDHGIGSSSQHLADVSGDGRVDAAIVLTGDWYVARGNQSGTGFSPWSAHEFGYGNGLVHSLANVGSTVAADGVAIDVNSGTWNVRLSNGGGLIRAPSSRPFGTGCAGSNGVPVLAPSGAAGTSPEPGNTLSNVISNVPNLPRIGIAGFSNLNNLGAPLPASLAALGAPGCDLYVSADVLDALITTTWQIPLPNSSSIIDAVFYLQIAQIDIGVNSLDASFSNALRIMVGE